MKIRISLVDDHRMFREALRLALSDSSEIEVVSEAGSGHQALINLANECPDVVLIDIALPDGSGIHLAKKIKLSFPTLKIIALSGYAEKVFVDEMLKAGAMAYVVKSAGTNELLLAISAVMMGQCFLSPEIMGQQCANITSSPHPPLSVLSQREQEVLRLLAQGLRSTTIGTELLIAKTTVDVHRRNIKKKLGLTTPAELTRYAVREGLLSL